MEERGVDRCQAVEVLLWHETPSETQTGGNPEGYASRHAMGFLN
jgi:hypothetical protein